MSIQTFLAQALHKKSKTWYNSYMIPKIEDDLDRELSRQTQGMNEEEISSHLNDLSLCLMDLILEKKMGEGKIVFGEVENGLLN